MKYGRFLKRPRCVGDTVKYNQVQHWFVIYSIDLELILATFFQQLNSQQFITTGGQMRNAIHLFFALKLNPPRFRNWRSHFSLDRTEIHSRNELWMQRTNSSTTSGFLDETQSDLFPISPLLRQLLISIKTTLFCDCNSNCIRYLMKMQPKCFVKEKYFVDSIRFLEFGCLSVSH